MKTNGDGCTSFSGKVSGLAGTITTAAVMALLRLSPGYAGTQQEKKTEQSDIPILSEEQEKTLSKETTQRDDIPLIDKDTEKALDELQPNKPESGRKQEMTGKKREQAWAQTLFPSLLRCMLGSKTYN